jgi:hypothetical protein
MATTLFRMLLDGISQHRARHLTAVTGEKRFLDGNIALTNFTQHPADGLVDEIVLVAQQQCRNAKRVREVELPDEAESGYDRNAPLPDQARACQCVEERAITVDEVRKGSALRLSLQVSDHPDFVTR